MQTFIGIKTISWEEYNSHWEIYDPNYAYVVYAKRAQKDTVEMYGIYKTEASAEKHADSLRAYPEDYPHVEVQRTYMPN